ncbi:MAG: hypothetical protein ACREVQ_07940 [Burkholderiales bacterium]
MRWKPWARWQELLDWAKVMRPARFAILMVLAALAFLVISEQGEDVVRALAERQTGGQDEWQRFFFFASVLAWSATAWYWARVMLRLAFPGVPGNDPRFHRLRTWLPRGLGTAAALGVSASLALAARGYTGDAHAQVRDLLHAYAFWCLLGALAFLAAVTLRRRLLRAMGMTRVQATGEVEYGAARLRGLRRTTLLVLAATLLGAVALLLVFTFALQATAPSIGTAAILLFAATGWIAGGSALDVFGLRHRFPVFIGLVALAILFSPLNDDHAVRTLAGPPPARPDLRALLRDWMKAQPARAEHYPIYLVDAEGGGIRAAWWTASVLGEIDGAMPEFGTRLFSLSGVSGGSLGAAVYAAILAERRAGRNLIAAQVARRMLGKDFLAPVAAAMLYPDLLQRLLPFPVPHFDRALALEEAWERAWREAVPDSNRFAEPMDALRAGPGWAPVLFLNATWVETGKRLIASQAAITDRDFNDAEDAQAFFAPRALRLSSAAHMSARFTYVSPAGTLVRDERKYGRVVDGGYFENSGATTTLEIALTIDNMADDPDEDPRWRRVAPTVIHISNEPVNPALAPEDLAHAAGHPRIAPGRWMPELLSPLITLLSTRGARGVYAREALHWHVGDEHFFHFGLCRESTNVPLGWVLSSSTRRNMRSQLAGEKCESDETPPRVFFDNRGNLERLRAER